MRKWLNAYLWGYKNSEAADHSFRKFREFYPDGDIFIKVDDNGDFENYKRVAKKYNAECSKNPFQIGYPGNHQQHNIGRECWPIDNALLWCDNIFPLEESIYPSGIQTKDQLGLKFYHQIQFHTNQALP